MTQVITVSLLYQSLIIGHGEGKIGELISKNPVYLAADSHSFVLAVLRNSSVHSPNVENIVVQR